MPWWKKNRFESRAVSDLNSDKLHDFGRHIKP